MLLRLFGSIGLLFILAGMAYSDDPTAARAKLIGTWREATADGHVGGTWSVLDKGETIRISHTADGQKVDEFECNTMGRECEIKDSGRHIKVSMWYNGPRLVEMETHGSEVIKRRLNAEAGDSMEIEVIPIQPAGKTEVIHLQRVQITAGGK